MSVPGRDALTVVRAPALELVPLPDGGAEIVVARTRRLRITPDARWLLERLDGEHTVAALAAELGERLGREVTPADAASVIERTLVAHGLAALATAGTPSPSLVRAQRNELLPAGAVRALARPLAFLAAPAVALPLLVAALAVLGVAGARIAAAGAAAWRVPWAWAAALPLAVAGILLHELAHAIAITRAGGTPGAIAIVRGRRGLRVATELAGLDALTPRGRVGVDAAGVAAQLVLAGGIAAAAFGAGRIPPAPALALLVLSALVELVPRAGTDGRWLADDLAGRDPADTLHRRVPPARWLARAGVRIAARLQWARRSGPLADVQALLPVFVSASFPDWAPGRLRAFARAHVESAAVARLDHADLVRAERADEVRHVRAVRRLLAEGRGAIVCGMHVGPYQYVPSALAQLGAPVAAYAAGNQQKAFAAAWSAGARRLGARLEILSPASVRDAVRAIRLVREGFFLYVLMDGQAAASRDQNRADFRFLGNELSFRLGPVLLARKAGAPLLLASTRYAGVARRVIEFSDPLPAPDGDGDAAAVERTAQMYAWFEQRVARVPEQWDGWVWPLAHWRATGAAPTATREQVDVALAGARRALAGEPRGARVVAEPARVMWTCWNGEHLIVHGPERRVLVASPLACRVLDAAFRHTRVADLPARTGEPPEALAPELARLSLAGLAELRGA